MPKIWISDSPTDGCLTEALILYKKEVLVLQRCGCGSSQGRYKIFPESNHHSFRHIWRLRARTNKGFRLKKVSHLRTCLRSLVAREGSRPVSWGLWLTYLTDHTFRCGPVNIWRATLINPKERLNIGLCLQSCTFWNLGKWQPAD